MMVRYYTVYHCPRYRIRHRCAEFCGNALEKLPAQENNFRRSLMRKTNGFAAIAAVTLFAVGLTGCDRTPK